MGERHINMFAGSPLNRLAWLRPSHSFLNAIVVLDSTRWLLFNSGQPLVAAKPEDPSSQTLAYLSTDDVRTFLGPEPFFGQGEDGSIVVESNDDLAQSLTASARHCEPRIIFLGLKELSLSTTALPTTDFVDPKAAIANLQGTPFFSMDVSDLRLPSEQLKATLDTSSLVQNGQILSWSEPRVLMSGLDTFSGAVFAEARSLVDWNKRNKFCPACGSRTYSMWGGWKLSCSSLLPWATAGEEPCLSSKGLHNFCHPRTDPVVIMLVINERGEKVLLGRGKRFPPKFYSALAGFVEPGETFEDAVEREIWEEVGAAVWNIKYHSGQPWPYPANLMLGFYMRADSSHPIRTDLDNELADARWYTHAEILSVLDPEGLSGRPRGSDNLDHFQATEPPAPAKPRATPESTSFTLPPATTLAGTMIRDWAFGKLGLLHHSLYHC
ncbi:putative NADH pyrophosphatase [Hypsizygus marmoreus]|uniref:NAD(+) diphosphatase n=1 Tax=Hypsizygus marmoreus TaxID=39966 RepID=A0A369JRS6_HYPMA|nr:putative NADH pyrophosphatase [Hypsizygus marmoreus]